MHRYQWRKPAELPDRVELFDTVTNRIIAAIVSVGRNWQWNRNTSPLFDGAPPSQGVARGLTQAKTCVLEGLSE